MMVLINYTTCRSLYVAQKATCRLVLNAGRFHRQSYVGGGVSIMFVNAYNTDKG